MLDPIIAISPLDGRYRNKLEEMSDYFSEFALFKYRVRVEIEWLIHICNEVKLKNTRKLTESEIKFLREIVDYFDVVAAKRVKEIEKETNHDVKAIEYYIKETLTDSSVEDLTEFVHFGCTSEDINNLSYALMIQEGTKNFVNSNLQGVIQKIAEMAKTFEDLPMLSLTHGQTASPTTVGKEFANVLARLDRYYKKIDEFKLTGKFNGATGNFNAHVSAAKDEDWENISERFVESLGLEHNPMTTQIEPHDTTAEYMNLYSQINTILIDFSRDIWMYISRGIFKQKLREGEIGSSTMPHKVNPIDFENAEGNMGLSNGIISHLSQKLPISRMQRDLSDSTVFRNVGTVFAYTVLGCKSMIKGLDKLEVNEKVLKKELADNPEILAEAIQTVMRLEGIDSPYEKLKKLTRGKRISLNDISKFVDGLEVDKETKKALKELTPADYIGLAKELTQHYLKKRK